MVMKSLDGMYRGGLYDHIGYGFTRYSTDERWLVPHFEKMLYDNALLVMAAADAYQVTRTEELANVIREVITYIERVMTDPLGGFYCAEDADSEGVEGKFYVWTLGEVISVLGEEEGRLFAEVYDITPEGNFESYSIPNLIKQTIDEYAFKNKLDRSELIARLDTSREKLFQAREARVHPHKDDKILTSWNGLMIAALSKAAKALQEPVYAQMAEKAYAFIEHKLVREDGRLLARYRDGESAILGYLDDYAFLSWGLIELYEATWQPQYILAAERYTEQMFTLFGDDQSQGFYFYGNDGEQLFTRTKEIYDGAMPSGNSAATMNLMKLARLPKPSRVGGSSRRAITCVFECRSTLSSRAHVVFVFSGYGLPSRSGDSYYR